MTNILIKKDEDRFFISLSGHAQYSEENDIVCSAVSALTETLLQAIEIMQEEQECIIVSSNENEKLGAVIIDVLGLIGYKKKLYTIIETIAIGYAMLEQTYPNNVKIKILL